MRAERINTIARLANAKRYLEIGVAHGETFFDVEIANKTAVDPAFLFDVASKSNRSTAFFPMTSDDFFKNLISDPFDIIYLDGLHTYEQTLRDFINSLSFAHARTVWIIDDTVPNDNFSALPDQERCYRLRRETGNDDWAWMGDVYKVVFFICNIMPFYHYRTFGGHGQTIVWRDLTRFRQSQSIAVDRIGSMSYEDFREHLSEMHPADDAKIFADVKTFLSSKQTRP